MFCKMEQDPLSPPQRPPAPALLGLAAVGGLFPLQALLALGGRARRRPCPEPLKPAALGAHSDVRAPSGNQGSFLCQSLCQGIWLAPTAQLAVAERGCAAGSAFLWDNGASPYHSPSPPTRVETVLAENDVAQLRHHFLAHRHLEGRPETYCSPK